MTTETQTKIVTEVEPEAVTEVVETQVPGLQGPQGEKGKTGTTFTPTVTKEGWVMWTNDGGAKNPTPVCIMGPQGDKGDKGDQGERGEKGETGKLNADDLKVIQEARSSAETSAATATEQAGIATERAEELTEAEDTLTTLSNDAVRFTSQEKTDAEKYQARKNIAASSQSEVEALKKQVANLQAQAEGKTFTYETDATEAYSKDVPEGAYPYAAVKSFGGKTIVWNQLAKIIGGYGIPAGMKLEIDNGVITYKGTLEAGVLSNVVGMDNVKVIANHKYYSVAVFFGTSVKNLGCSWAMSSSKISLPSADGTPAVVTAAGTGSAGMNLQIISAETKYIELKFAIMMVDLTRMFGVGNEPTAEEFLQMFPENYYKYNAGELKSAPVNNLKIIGKNILSVDGELSIATYKILKLPFYIEKGETVVLTATVVSATASNGTNVLHNGSIENGSSIWSLSVGKHTTTIKASGRSDLIRIYAGGDFQESQGQTLVLKDIQLERGTKATDYSPYKEENRAIPQAVLDLEGYGWSAGTAKNWVDWEKKEYHREVGSVDLGSKNWWNNPETSTSKQRFTCYGTGIKINPVSDGVSNLLTCPYVTETWTNIVSNADKDKIISALMDSENSYVAVRDSTYTDVASFKKSVQGVLLYYELAEPEIIDISDILPDDNLLEVEEGGTITFENSNGDGFRIPVPSEIVYQKKVTTDE